MGRIFLARLSVCIVLLACGLFGTPPIYASVSTLGKPAIRLFWPKDYGQHKQNWAVKVDEDGLVYVANGHGVLIYDGVRWEYLGTPGGATWVFGLDLGSDGRIFLGTMADFGYFDADSSASWRYVSVSSKHKLNSLNMVRRAVAHSAGAFYATKERVYWDRGDGELRHFPVQQSVELFNVAGALFVTDNAGLHRFDFSVEAFLPAVGDGSLLSGARISSLVAMDDGGVLISTRNDALFRLYQGRLSRFPTQLDEWMRKAVVTRLLLLDDGRLIVGSRNDGIVVVDKDGALERHIGEAEGLPWPQITGIARDHQGGIWLSCDGGIARIDLDSGITYFDASNGVEGTVQMLTAHANRLFAGTARGLVVLEPAPKGHSANFRKVGERETALWSILDVGSELLTSDSDGINALTFDADVIAPRSSQVYSGRRAVNMIRSRGDANRVYAALADGVLRLRRTDAGWVSDGKLDGVTQHTQYVAEDSQGDLWVSTLRQAVYRVTDLERWPQSSVQAFSGESGLPDSKIHIYNIDEQLVMSSELGAFLFDEGQFSRHPTLLQGGAMHRALQLENGDVWTSYGIYRRGADGQAYQFDSVPYRLFPFGVTSGIYATPDQVWLSGDAGIFRVELGKYSVPDAPAGLSIRSVSDINRSRVFFGGASSDSVSQAFSLRPEETNLRFQYALADYATPDKTRYRYRLLGLSDVWSNWAGETQTDFTNLPGGDFRFELQAMDASEQAADVVGVSFTKQPYWFLSVWAIIAYAIVLILLFGASAFYGQRWRTRRLEAIIDARTETISQQKEELQQMSDAKSRFFANVSHEFRTPLTLTIGPLDDLMSDRSIGLEGDARRYVELARDNARRSLGLLGEILDINRLAENRFRLHIEEYDLAMLARKVTQRFEDHAQRNQIELQIEGIEKVVNAHFDSEQIDRCLSNLLSNAIKFTPAGGYICVALTSVAKALCLSVKDNGAGIDESEIAQVFDRYYQGQHNTPSQPGTGIGLALVEELMTLHGGSVSVVSAVGEGSRFSLHLPLDLAATETLEQSTDAQRSSLEPQSPVAEASVATKTLLVVDDNAELREFLRMRLCTRYRILEAADGVEALQVVGEELPDVIISDVMMPNMDGIALARALKQDPQFEHIPLLLLTAKDTKRDTVEGLQSGANDYLAKPFDTSELIARIAGLLAHQQRLRRHLRLELQQAALELKPQKQRFAENFEAAVSRRLADGAIEIDQLAEELCIERSTLFRRVEKHFDCTPQQFIRQRRLELAAQLLRAGRGSVSEIAYAVGFESLNYFSRCYRQSYGWSPSQDLRADG